MFTASEDSRGRFDGRSLQRGALQRRDPDRAALSAASRTVDRHRSATSTTRPSNRAGTRSATSRGTRFDASRYTPETLAAARLSWSRKAWTEYGGLPETPALIIRFCLEHERESDPKYFLTVRNTEEAWHLECCHRFAEALRRVMSPSRRARVSRAVQPGPAPRGARCLAQLDAYVAAHVGIQDGLDLELCRLHRDNAADPVARAILDRLVADKTRHAAFGWFYLESRAAAWSDADRADDRRRDRACRRRHRDGRASAASGSPDRIRPTLSRPTGSPARPGSAPPRAPRKSRCCAAISRRRGRNSRGSGRRAMIDEAFEAEYNIRRRHPESPEHYARYEADSAAARAAARLPARSALRRGGRRAARLLSGRAAGCAAVPVYPRRVLARARQERRVVYRAGICRRGDRGRADQLRPRAAGDRRGDRRADPARDRLGPCQCGTARLRSRSGWWSAATRPAVI